MNETELVAAISTPTVVAADGTPIPRKDGVRPEFAVALHRLVAERQPESVLEVGMAQGVSSVAITSALAGGQLTSIDPHQRTDWQGVGLRQLSALGLADRHQLIEEYDYLALPDLVRRGNTYDMAYIDGWHTFDYTLLDLFYADKVLKVGGVLGLNDCGFAAVDAAIRAFLAHRDYVELPINPLRLGPAHRGNGRSLPKGGGKLVRVLPRPVQQVCAKVLPGRVIPKQDRFFEKRSADEPAWDFFEYF